MENLADCIRMWMIDYKKNSCDALRYRIYRICGALTHIAAWSHVKRRGSTGRGEIAWKSRL